jgi:hypothetical protein
VLIGMSHLAGRSTRCILMHFLHYNGTYLTQRAPHAVASLCRCRDQRRFVDGMFGMVRCMHDIDHATPYKCPQLINNWVFTFPQAHTISNQPVSVQELFVHVYLTQLLPTSFLQNKEDKLAQIEDVTVGNRVQSCCLIGQVIVYENSGDGLNHGNVDVVTHEPIV